MRTVRVRQSGRIRTCSQCGQEFYAFLGAHRCPVCRVPRSSRLPPRPGAPLSPREKQLAVRITSGLPNKLIAAELHLTVGTVKEYLNRLFRKLELHNRTELAMWAVKHPEAVAPTGSPDEPATRPL